MYFVLVPLLAVAVILAATWRWGGVRTARIAHDTDVHAVLAQEHPEWRATEVARALDARLALACAPPDPAVAVVFAHGDLLTSRLLRAGDVRAVESPPPVAGQVTARLRLHDVGCPQLALVLPGDTWATWAPRLQRLVGVSVLLLAVASARPIAAQVHASRGMRASAALAPAALAPAALAPAARSFPAPCDDLFRASWTPEAPRPGTLFTVQLTTARRSPGSGVPGARVGNEPLHLRGADSRPTTGAVPPPAEDEAAATAPGGTTWRALAAVPIDAERSIALRLACPDASGDSATIRIPLASASYPMERLSVAPRYSAPPDSALAARMAREAERAGQVSRQSHETPRQWTTPFVRPRTSRVTSSFGRGRVFNGSVTSRHMGTDYAGVTGAPVHAANRGIVRLVDEFHLGGNVVYLDHGEGLVTAYLHLSKQLVAEGDTVERGDRIGLVGATGRVTGPHLHWIARYGRVSVDPASLLRVTADVAGKATSSGREALDRVRVASPLPMPNVSTLVGR